VLSMVGEGAMPTMFAAATAAARDELGGEANETGRDVAGGVVVAPKTGVLVGIDEFGKGALGDVTPGGCLLELQLLWGGVALHWAGVPAGLSTSIGEASVGGIAAATKAYKLGAEVVGVAVTSWEAGESSVSIGVGGWFLRTFGGRGFGSHWRGAEER